MIARIFRKRINLQNGGEVRRFGTKPDGHKVLLTGSHQAVDHRAEFLAPLGAAGKHNGSRAGDYPFSAGNFVAVMAAPAVVVNFQAETGRSVEVSLKGERLFFLPPPAQNPSDGRSSRQESHNYMRALEHMRRESQLS